MVFGLVLGRRVPGLARISSFVCSDARLTGLLCLFDLSLISRLVSVALTTEDGHWHPHGSLQALPPSHSPPFCVSLRPFPSNQDS